MATKPFNIDEVVAGAKIVQRSGESAKFLMYVEESSDEDNVLWLNETGRIHFSCKDGSYYGPGEGNTSGKDLFIWESDPEPKKVIQAYIGTRTEQGKDFKQWYDTLWDNVEHARERFPNEIYREVLVTA